MRQAPLPSFHGIIGRSAPMQALFRRIERVAPIDVPILIQGESGTGKELVAIAIQQLSSRRDRRFEVVNCGALSRELLLSELFGHERGAFTGAVARKPGLLALADGGTLFLDEVAELSPEAQAMLLRFLQHGEMRPVGSTETARVDVRLISATHRNLETAVERGTIREDLYYRLRRVVLEVPPLRERREDIPLLAEHLRREFSRRYRLAVEGLTARALRRLEAHPWPGNVRELEAVLEQAMIFKARGWLGPGDLDLRPVAHEPTGASQREAGAGQTLTPYQEEALRIAERQGEVRRRDLVHRCGISREAARRHLLTLARMGFLCRIGNGRGARYVLPHPSDEAGGR